MKTQPVWPCIIKHDEVYDVAYIATYDDWLKEKSLSQFPYGEHDLMIDHGGSVFKLEYNKHNKSVSFIPTIEFLSLEEFSSILRKHLCTTNECCISKVSATSYAEGFEMIRQSLADDK
ncbi:MAG TPA: DUF4144 family protein [Gammaproteobacteria bacterium]